MTNNELHEYKARIYNLHLPVVNLVKFDEGAYITSIKVFNHLPQSIKILINNEKSFKTILKGFLYQDSFYCMNKCYQCTGEFKIVICGCIVLYCIYSYSTNPNTGNTTGYGTSQAKYIKSI
jgi:hypothetical protein